MVHSLCSKLGSFCKIRDVSTSDVERPCKSKCDSVALRSRDEDKSTR